MKPKDAEVQTDAIEKLIEDRCVKCGFSGTKERCSTLPDECFVFKAKKQLESENAALKAELDRYKGALRTLAKEYVADLPILNEPEDVKAIGIEQRIRLMIAYALAHPSNALDEILSKEHGADGVGLTHAEIDSIEKEETK